MQNAVQATTLRFLDQMPPRRDNAVGSHVLGDPLDALSVGTGQAANEVDVDERPFADLLRQPNAVYDLIDSATHEKQVVRRAVQRVLQVLYPADGGDNRMAPDFVQQSHTISAPLS